ncbi:acyl-CoA synthetase [Piscinibacter sp. XHJ-5]|uniref:acyl-CoA synthetase n=1 Tax=Piscinibacter sp. XHJ-5 TaxID=3037797 RepID=UPI002452AFF2|nr:acyl-CoA synthetase [Piscinibacter sp. XHJ-5]
MSDWLEARLRMSDRADVEAFECTPLADWRLPGSVYDAIRGRATTQSQAPAIRFIPDGETPGICITWTFAELLQRITQVANFMHTLGVRAGDKVAVLMPNTPDAHASIWAAETIGVVVPINYMLEPEQISSIIRDSGSTTLIAQGPHPDFDIWQKVPLLDAPELQRVLWAPAAGISAKSQEQLRDDLVVASRKVQLHALADYLDEAHEKLMFEPEQDPHRLAALFHTGGTTGAPKLAMQTHWNQIVNAWQQGLCMSMEPGHVRLCGLPVFHVNGAIANGLVLFMAGACLVLTGIRGFRDAGVMRNFWRIVELYRAQSLGAVPTFLVSLAQTDVGDCDISSLEFVRCGTAPLSRQLARDFSALAGVEVIEGYGLTEGTSISSMNPRFGEKRIGSVGIRIPYQLWEIRKELQRGSEWQKCAVGELGAVFISGPNVIPGYVEGKESDDSFSPDGWYNTGDLGAIDADGYLWLTGREKDIIIRGGHNLDPRMIEEALYANPAVQHAAAIGRPDRYVGEMPIAYVSLQPGVDADSESLLRFAAQRIPERAAIPKFVKIVREMPLTAVGKIFKPALRKDATFDGYADALGGMIGAYNLAISVTYEGGGTAVRLEATNLSPIHHDPLRRFVRDALKTFTVQYELAFSVRY